MKAFPPRLFVKLERDGDDSYFVAGTHSYDMAEQGERINIAEYRLVDVKAVELELKVVKSRTK